MSFVKSNFIGHIRNLLMSVGIFFFRLAGRWGYAASGIMFSMVPLFLLLRFNPKVGFYDDWFDNLWFVGYTGEYFLRHFSFPGAFNTHSSVGITLPAFYGYTLYPVLGVFSSVIGANSAVRLALFGLYALQFFCVAGFISRITNNKVLGAGAGILVLWAVYPLTNIYNRGSLPEVFAGGFLTIAAVLFLRLFWEPELRSKILVGCLWGLAMTMAVGSWPPALIQGIIVLFVEVLIIIILRDIFPGKTQAIKITAVAGLLSGLVLTPLVYIAMLFRDKISVLEHGLAYYRGIDDWFIRFCPFPLDGRALYKGLEIPEGTPYLDAQVNIPLLMLAVFLMSVCAKNMENFSRVKGLLLSFCAAFLLFGYFTWMSLSPAFAAHIPDILKTLHFHYRFITYQNLALLVALICTALVIPKCKMHPLWGSSLNIVMAFLIGMAATSVVIKNVHGNSIIGLYTYDSPGKSFGFRPLRHRNTLLDMPGTAGHIWGYRTLSFYTAPKTGFVPIPAKRVVIPVGLASSFGIPEGPVVVSLSSPGLISVNMYPFIWNELEVDGMAVPPGDLYILDKSDLTVAVHLNSGTHEIRYRFRPDLFWQVSRTISLLLLFVWIISVPFLFFGCCHLGLPRRWEGDGDVR